MKFQQIEFTVAGHYLSALINGDDSGLTDEESRDVEEFDSYVRAQAPSGTTFSHYSTENDEEGSFAECDICQLHADCYALTALYN